ncbi:MAG: hypothetical protein EOP81_07280 [Variovorax sp.]|nr:MAG: hypothetical protein EOP81_07280 [Variovorax sp.]
MTWFGITNWHYQIGNKGVMLDGEVVNGGRTANAEAVTKALDTLVTGVEGNSVDVVLLGHVHPDHSIQLPEWAKQTGKMVYAPPAACNTLVGTNGIPEAQCVGLKGGEVIKLDDFTNIRAVRWVHSVGCGEFSNGTGGPETFGFLFTTKIKSGETLSWFVSDSGAGGPDLTAPRVVTTTVNGERVTTTYGSPLQNLREALKAEGLESLDVWQGGPESRMVYQARTVIPEFDVKLFMPHHLNSRAANGQSFNLSYGMHYGYSEDDQPKLKQFLAAVDVPQIYPTNYWDAWSYGKEGVRAIPNAKMKSAYGLPETGPGPGQQYPNPRAGDLECDYD